MYEIFFHNKAKEQLNKLNSDIKQRIISSLERIRLRPFHFIKRKQRTPYFIFRVGNYRLILDIIKNKLIIIVIEVGHRKKIYKKK